MIFTNDTVTGENHWRVASWVAQIVIHNMSFTSLLLMLYFIRQKQKSDEKDWSITDFAIDGFF